MPLQIIHMTQNNIGLMAEHCGFMKHTSDPLNAIFLPAQVQENSAKIQQIQQ